MKETDFVGTLYPLILPLFSDLLTVGTLFYQFIIVQFLARDGEIFFLVKLYSLKTGNQRIAAVL